MEKLIIQAVDPKSLMECDFIRIHEVMQDMWASEDWLGELAQCNDCGKMMSKENVFWYLPEELIQETVTHIMRILWTESIPCTFCGGKTRLRYGCEHVEKIRERVIGSVDAFLVLCISETKWIVGFEEAYIDSLDRMFHLDFADHYENIWLPEITQRVNGILGYLPDKLLLTSALGLLKPYRNFRNLFGIMSQFARILPDSYLWMPGLAELERGGVTHRMSVGINQGISLWIEDVPELREKMTSVWEKYQSDFVVYPDYVKMLKKNFILEQRQFLRMLRGKSDIWNRSGVMESPMMASV